MQIARRIIVTIMVSAISLLDHVPVLISSMAPTVNSAAAQWVLLGSTFPRRIILRTRRCSSAVTWETVIRLLVYADAVMVFMVQLANIQCVQQLHQLNQNNAVAMDDV